MMEFKRVWNVKTVVTLICLTVVCAILFYNRQIQNGTDEILQYNEYYDQNSYSIFDVNNMECDMIYKYKNAAWRSGQSEETGEIKAFVSWYYNTYIGKDSPKRDVFLVTKEIFAEKAEYVDGYTDRINNMCENAKTMIRIGAFSDKNSFAYQNILKTSYDLADNAKIKTTLSEMRAWESVYDYKIAGWFHLFFMIVIVYQFFSERKKGLWNIIFLAADGRWKMSVKRLGILIISSVVSAVVLYGAIWIESLFLYNGWGELSVNIQSSRVFADVFFHINKIQYILVNIIICICTAIALAALIWGIMSAAKSQAGFMVTFICILIPEYFFYRVISERSTFSILKYFNIFQLIQPMDSLVEYNNCRIGNVLFGRTELMSVMAAAILPVGLFLSVWAAQKNHPVHSFSKMKKITDKICDRYHCIVAKLPPAGLEIYKFLVIQKGIIVFMVLAVLISGIKIFGGVSYDEERVIMREYYQKTEGMTLGESVYDEITKYREKLMGMKNEYKELTETAKEEKEIDGAKSDTLKKDIAVLSSAVEEMQQQAEYLESVKAAKGVKPEIVSPYVYENMFGGRLDYNTNMLSMYVFLALIFLMNGAFAYEKRDNMTTIIRSCSKGRKFFAGRKLMIESILTVIIGLAVYGYYYGKVLSEYHLTCLDSSILCLEYMKDFPVNISIRQYLILGVAWKLILMWTGVMIITIISLFFREKAALLMSMMILVPHMLYLLGFEGFKHISVIIPMNTWQMWRIYPKEIIYMIYITVPVIGVFVMSRIVSRWKVIK